jgi:hypothetical protein
MKPLHQEKGAHLAVHPVPLSGTSTFVSQTKATTSSPIASQKANTPSELTVVFAVINDSDSGPAISAPFADVTGSRLMTDGVARTALAIRNDYASVHRNVDGFNDAVELFATQRHGTDAFSGIVVHEPSIGRGTLFMRAAGGRLIAFAFKLSQGVQR